MQWIWSRPSNRFKFTLWLKQDLKSNPLSANPTKWLNTLKEFGGSLSSFRDEVPNNNRSSRPEVFLGKGVLKIWSKITGEHRSRSVISVETILRHGCSPVNLLHIFRIPFLKNTSGWLLCNKVLKNDLS